MSHLQIPYQIRDMAGKQTNLRWHLFGYVMIENWNDKTLNWCKQHYKFMARLSFVNKLMDVKETCSSFPVFHETLSLTSSMKIFVSCSFCATLKTTFAFIDSLRAPCFCMSCRCFGETGSLFIVFIYFIFITVRT